MAAPTLAQTLSELGFVQLDSIRVVSRAHHHILWSRDQSYRETDLRPMAFTNRGAFEHFGHDASLFPMDTFPKWTRRFRQFREKLSQSNYYKNLPDASARAAIRERIAREGPLCSADFPAPTPRPKGMWARPPTKQALDFMWYCGELSTAYRHNFRKYYDLTERIIPADVREAEWDDAAQIDWLCRAALRRLGFGNAGEIARFWNAVNLAEVKQWMAAHAGDLIPVEVETGEGGWITGVMLAELEPVLASLGVPTSRLRILNPFDPAMRDRKRLQALFGFEYVNEIFIPREKRRWGYYVYPLLEGDRMVGRVDLSSVPRAAPLRPIAHWSEAGATWTKRRQARLEAELARLDRLRQSSS